MARHFSQIVTEVKPGSSILGLSGKHITDIGFQMPPGSYLSITDINGKRMNFDIGRSGILEFKDISLKIRSIVPDFRIPGRKKISIIIDYIYEDEE